MKYKYETSNSESESSTNSDSTSDSDSEDSKNGESESEHEIKHHKGSKTSRKEKYTVKSTKTSSTGSHSKPKEEAASNKKAPNEINSLIEEMSKLSLTDPNYAKAYFKALSIEPLMSQIVAKPQRADSSNNQKLVPTTSPSANDHTPTEILQ